MALFTDNMVELAPSDPNQFTGPQISTSNEEFKNRETRTAEHILMFPPAAAAGAVQTFGESLYLFNSNSVEKFLNTYMQPLGSYYSRNKSPAQTVGDLTGLFIPAIGASKILRTVQGLDKISELTQSSRLAKTIIGRSGEADEVLGLLRARDRYLSSRGAFDVLDQDITRKQLARRARTAGAGEVIRDTIAGELAILGTMHSSDTLYPEDFTAMDHLALNALFPGVFAAARVSQINKLIRNSAQSVARESVLARNPADLPLDQIISQPGNRDLGLTVYAEARKVAARERDQAASTDTDIKSNFDRDEKAFSVKMKEQVELLGKDTIVKDWTKRTVLSKEQVQTIMDAENDFPTTMLGAYSVQNVPDNVQGFLNHGKNLAKTKRIQIANIRDRAGEKGRDLSFEEAEQIDKLRKKEELLMSTETYILAADGSMLHAKNYKKIFQDDPEKIITVPRVPGKESRKYTVKQIGFSEEGLVISGHGAKEGGRVKQLKDFSLDEHTSLYALAQRAVKNYKLGEFKIAVPKDANYVQLDYIMELHNKFGNAIMKDLSLPKEWTAGLADVEINSLAQKFKEYKRLRQTTNQQLRSGIKLPQSAIINKDEIARRLNLPLTPFGEIHPVMGLFESIMVADDDFLKAFGDTSHIRRALQEEAFWPHQVQYADADKLALRGKMINWPENKQSSLILKRPVNPLVGTGQTIQRGIEQTRLMKMKGLGAASEYEADLVKLVFDELTTGTAAGATRVAQDVTSLAVGTTRTSQLANLQLTKAMIMAENPSLQAVQAVEVLTDKIFRNQVGKIFEQHNQTFATLRADKGAMDEFNLYTHMRRQGWDLEEASIHGEALNVLGTDGKFMFTLSNTAENKARFERTFGREMEEGDLAPSISPNYVPLAMNEKSFAAASAVNHLDTIYLSNTNHLRRLEGLMPIRRKPWHVPPKNLAKEELFYLIRPDGRLHSVAHGKTIAEAKAKADAETTAAKANGLNLITQSQQDMAKYFSIKDEAFGAMVDFTDVLRQTARAKGTSVGLIVDTGPEVLNDIIRTQSQHFESVLRRTRAMFFEPQLNYMQQMLSRSAPISAARRGESPWQMYTASIMGNPSINPNDIAGRGYFAIENIMDNMLNAAWDRMRESKGIKAPAAVKNPDAAYNRLKESLGDFNPFQNAADYAERTLNVKHPPQLKRLFAGLNSFTSLVTLRLMEVSHSLLTLMSLGATMPGVIAGARKQIGETQQQHSARVGTFYRLIDKDNAMFSPARAMADSFHFMFTKEGREVYKRASELGFMDQTVAEIFKTMTAPQQGYHSNLIKNIGRITTFLSDESERLARGISFITGYRIATKGLEIKNEKAAFAFGHRFADEVIGNYHPNNRPKMFQGAVGMPLGLFMTFMQNYYQRLFGYIESRDARAAVIQFATQASVFGGSTVPGFNQFADFFASNYDGSTNIVDGMYSKFGDDVTDAFLYGGVANIPFMYGFGDGFGIYQRGDTSIRSIPSVFTLENTPIVTMFRDGFNAVGEAVSAARSGGFTDQRIAEILGSYSTNRFLRNMAMFYADVSVDRRGQVVSRDIRSDFGAISRLAGLRPLSETSQSEAYYRLRSTEFSRAAGMERLRDNVRSRARDGSLNADTVNDAVAEYAKYGGSVQHFGRFLRDNIIVGTVDREQKKVIDLLKSSNRAQDALRLMEVLPE